MIVCYHCLLFVSLEKFLLEQDLCHCNKLLPSYEAETQTDQKLTNCRIDNVDETQHRTSQRSEHEPKILLEKKMLSKVWFERTIILFKKGRSNSWWISYLCILRSIDIIVTVCISWIPIWIIWWSHCYFCTIPSKWP